MALVHSGGGRGGTDKHQPGGKGSRPLRSPNKALFLKKTRTVTVHLPECSMNAVPQQCGQLTFKLQSIVLNVPHRQQILQSFIFFQRTFYIAFNLRCH